MFRVPKAAIPNPSTTVSMSPFSRQSKEQNQCSYSLYECNRPCLETYSYCMKHILEDPNAPYKQCSFIYNLNGKRCLNPAQKGDRRDAS